MEDLNDTTNPENTIYSVFQARADSRVPPYSTEKITALTFIYNLLFVGTKKGVVTQYLAEEQEIDCTCFSFTELMARTIASDSPILKMDSCASMNLLAILCDHTLTLCDAEQFERVGLNVPCRDVVTFHLRDSGTESVKLSLAFVSKRIQIYMLAEGTAELVFETMLDSTPTSICLTANFLGLVNPSRYLSVNVNTKVVTELSQFDPVTVVPFITAVEKDVFLIAGPGSLGIIVNANGTSLRPPIHMSPNVLSVFVWKDYVYTVTDEFFTIHSLQSQNQLQTVIINNATAACFSAQSMHFVFVGTWSKRTEADGPSADLLAVGPERWDRFARKLILAGCINEAGRLLGRQRSRVNAVVQQRPVSSKNELNMFLKRSRRVFGLMGFYHFEEGNLKFAEKFFEKALIDIRELLYRYEDLLPKGYTFQPDPFYQLCSAENTKNQMNNEPDTRIRSVTDLSLLHALTEASQNSARTEDAIPDPVVTSEWTVRYNRFLFDFLQKHHKSKFTEASCHFLETALVKLYLKLSAQGVKPFLNELVLPCDRLEATQLRILCDKTMKNCTLVQDLIQLIFNLVHIDVDDLVIFLQQSGAHHALALIYQWQGDLAAALDVWQRLAYGELYDENFPSGPFYVAALHSLMHPEPSLMEPGIISSNSAEDVPITSPLPSAYVNLVWRHLCRALDAKKWDLAEQILSGIPVSFTNPNRRSPPHLSDEARQLDQLLAPSQLLAPDNIISRLHLASPELARNYLRQLIYNHMDEEPAHHNMLATLYVDTILSQSNASNDASKANETVQKELRREFCHFLRYSEHYSVDQLLNRVRELDSVKLPFEMAILLGRADQHRTALNLLVNQQSDLAAALCYCLSFSATSGVRTGRKLSKHSNDHSLFSADAFEVCEQPFTTLVELCFDSGISSHEQLGLELINTPTIPLNVVRVLRALPSHVSISQIQPFLNQAFTSVLHNLSTGQLSLGLAKRQAFLAAEIVQTNTERLPMFVHTGKELCDSCCQPITLYGPTSAFVRSTQTDHCFHVSCWEQSHRVV